MPGVEGSGRPLFIFSCRCRSDLIFPGEEAHSAGGRFKNLDPLPGSHPGELMGNHQRYPIGRRRFEFLHDEVPVAAEMFHNRFRGNRPVPGVFQKDLQQAQGVRLNSGGKRRIPDPIMPDLMGGTPGNKQLIGGVQVCGPNGSGKISLAAVADDLHAHLRRGPTTSKKPTIIAMEEVRRGLVKYEDAGRPFEAPEIPENAG